MWEQKDLAQFTALRAISSTNDFSLHTIKYSHLNYFGLVSWSVTLLINIEFSGIIDLSPSSYKYEHAIASVLPANKKRKCRK